MSEKIAADLDELASIVIGQQAVIAALLSALRRNGTLSQTEMNEVFDHALVALEVAEPERQPTIQMSRRRIEDFAATMSGEREA